MQATMDETNRRRVIQVAYNEEHGITPRTVSRTREQIEAQQSILDVRGKKPVKAYIESDDMSMAADPVLNYMSKDQLQHLIVDTEIKMKQAAKDLDFISAAQFRDELFALKKKLTSA